MTEWPQYCLWIIFGIKKHVPRLDYKNMYCIKNYCLNSFQKEFIWHDCSVDNQSTAFSNILIAYYQKI